MLGHVQDGSTEREIVTKAEAFWPMRHQASLVLTSQTESF